MADDFLFDDENNELAGNLVLDVNANKDLENDGDLNADAYEKRREKRRKSRQSFGNSENTEEPSSQYSQTSSQAPSSQVSEYLPGPAQKDNKNKKNNENKTSTPPTTAAPATHSKQALGEIKTTYRSWLQIVADNKLNKHDPFKLKLIDYMSDMCNSRDNCSNFQFAATSVDAGARIYAKKVDAVHENTLRVLREISEKKPKKSKSHEEDTEMDTEMMDDETEQETGTQKNSSKSKKNNNKKSKHLFTEEVENNMLAKTRKSLIDPKLKYQHILNSMTNTNIGELSKMNVANELSKNDSGVPEELSELFEEQIELANPSIKEPDLYPDKLPKRLMGFCFGNYMKQYKVYQEDYSRVFCPTIKYVNLNDRKPPGVKIYQDGDLLGLKLAEDREILPSSRRIFNEEEEIIKQVGVDETVVMISQRDGTQNDEMNFEQDDDIAPPGMMSDDDEDQMVMMPEVEEIQNENLENSESAKIPAPTPTPVNLNVSQDSNCSDNTLIQKNNDLSKFDDFCDEIRDLAFQNSQKFTTDVDELRLNQLTSTKSFQPKLSQQEKTSKTKTKEKVRKSPRIPVNFKEDIPLAKIGCTVSATGKKRKKPTKTFTKAALAKQTKAAKLDNNYKETDFDFDEFKKSFAKLNNYPNCIIGEGRHDNAIEFQNDLDSYKETQTTTELPENDNYGNDFEENDFNDVPYPDEPINPEIHEENDNNTNQPQLPSTPEINLAPPAFSQTPGNGMNSTQDNFLNKFPPQTPARNKAANQIVSNFKRIDAREVKVHMWNLIENDDLLPRKGRPKNCDKEVEFSNYKEETRREEVKKFSDLQVGSKKV